VWLERCALAGIHVFLGEINGRVALGESWENGGVSADRSQVTFLACWLNLTPGAARTL